MPPTRPLRRHLGIPTTVAARLAPIVLAASSVAGCSGPIAVDDAPPKHLLLVTVDTLRADHMGMYGYPRETSPFLDALARESVLFEHPVAQWPKTGPSFASMFTGQYPQTTGLTHAAALNLPEGFLTLPELFRDAGFTTVAVVSNAVLASHLGWSQGFDEYVETWKNEAGQSEDPKVWRRSLFAPLVNEHALDVLERHADAERLFAWIHYSDPHAPYYLPEGTANPFVGDEHYTEGPEVALERPETQAIGDRRDLGFYVAQYDANVLVVDRHVEELLRRADELGILDEALVVFTADHGESLGEHDYYFAHGRLPYDPTIRVPLLMHDPGRVAERRRVTAPVELVDLYPTLRDTFFPGTEVAGLEGDTLLPLLDPKAVPTIPDVFRYAFLEAGGGTPTTHWRGVRDERYKLVYHPALEHRGEVRPPVLELYDLVEDPGETVNLMDERRGETLRLKEVLWGWMKGTEWIRRPRSFVEEHSEETKRALKALGYL